MGARGLPPPPPCRPGSVSPGSHRTKLRFQLAGNLVFCARLTRLSRALIGKRQIQMRFRQLRIEFNGALMFAHRLRHSTGLAVTNSQKVMQRCVFESARERLLEMDR